MADASNMLFTDPINGKPLFRKQLDLVQDLLSLPGSVYHTDPSNKAVYDKQQIRLKTLVSQLLSPSVCRNIPVEFTSALRNVILNKVQDPALTDRIVDEIIEDLRQKNDLSNKGDTKTESNVERIKGDLKMATYVAIITANPLEIESESQSEGLSLRHIFINELLESIRTDQIFLKKYRILLPLEPSCMLFWKGLKENIVKFIKEHRGDDMFIKNLRKKYGTSHSPSQPDLFDSNPMNDDGIRDLTTRLITTINNQGFLLVYWHTSPLFNLPLIAINPAEVKNAKIYALLDREKSAPVIHQYSSDETIMWRYFVWDRLKTKQYSGNRIDFTDSVNNQVEL